MTTIYPQMLTPSPPAGGSRGLDPERDGLTTASQAPLIINGTNAQLYQLWLERTHQQPREDLSDSFPVQWGAFCEPFVLDWHERHSQLEISERQRFVKHPTLPKIACTLDGYRSDDTVIECKVLSPFAKSQSNGNDLGFVDFYAPQVVVQMACRKARFGALLVQQGNTAPVTYPIIADDNYVRTVFERLAAFQICVDTNSPPSPPPPAPVLPDQWRSFDLDASPLPNWGHALKPTLNLWRDTKETAAIHEQTKKDVKTILPDDVGRVAYGQITIKRARNGAVSITEEK